MGERLSQEEAVRRMKSIHPGFDFSRFVYRNSKTDGIIICEYGHEFLMDYEHSYKRKQGCPFCAPNRKLTQEKAVKIMQEKLPGYDFSLFVYVNENTDGIIICDKGHHYNSSYHNVKKGHKCTECNKYRKLSPEEAVSNLKAAEPSYDFSEFKFIRANIDGWITCSRKHRYQATYTEFMQGIRCPECSPTRPMTQEEAVENMRKIKPEYNFSYFRYENATTKSFIICDKGHGYYTDYHHFMRPEECPDCSEFYRKPFTQEEAVSTMKSLVPEYDYSNFTYINARTRSMIICNEGHDFLVCYDKFVNGNSRCPVCNSSKGETVIREWLVKHGINFEAQKHYPDLVNKRQLSYDFYIEEKNLLIEFNGMQHYLVCPYFHKKGLMNLREQFRHDMIKKRYAEKNNINLLVISYNQIDETDRILKQLLSEPSGQTKL